MSNCILKIEHLKKYYGNIKGVEDVSLQLNKGDIYGFIGPNGAGKSTTIRSIMGLINITSGEIFFNDKPLDMEDISIKEKIGYLPSEINLYDDMLVKEMFDYHASFYQKKTISKRRKELVKLLKIDESKKIEDLSLGNLKKVGIVLALMHEPELLILDEPTSGLDPLMQSIFHNILLEEKEKGTTILYSSHVLSEVSSISNKIGFIKDGIIIKEDLIENILKNNFTYLTISSKDIDTIKKDLSLTIKKESDKEVTFINNMNINDLIEKLSHYKIDKLLVENISLEDLFENYYK
ncbi:MAG: ABC transporter ATP-binding protein [Bacilli bacterium]|nr:ABC transporter ATP-binding protein [Bacilli bacterium]